MSVFDLRLWLADAEKRGELEYIRGAAESLEIGAASQLNYRRERPRALLFDEIVGHDAGQRVLTGSLASPSLLGASLCLGTDLSDHQLVTLLRGKPAQWLADVPDFPPLEVPTGPLLENEVSGPDVDFSALPCPVWHEGDGGPYIGTGCAVVTVDPETGVPNLGTYRIQIHDDGRAVTINMEAGKHGTQHVRRWFEKEGRAPVAASLGHHPVLLVVAGTEVPFGISELAYAGAILGERIPVIRGPHTGLPIPAESEIAFEGWLYPGQTRLEGPFGEWTGYYSGAASQVLCVEPAALYYRDDPVNLGAPPGKPPHDYSYMRAVMKSAMATDALAGAGLAGVAGVWCHEAGGGRAIIAVAIEQRYPGHSRQAGYLAAQHPVTAYMNKIVIVVDADINPRNLDEVMWAVATRCDPAIDLDVMHRTWGSRVDPLGLPGQVAHNSRVLIDASRPFERLGDFPVVAECSADLLARAASRWPQLSSR